ncbi:MAG: hypothetical protein ACR2KT_15295 [Methylocella sp.]
MGASQKIHNSDDVLDQSLFEFFGQHCSKRYGVRGATVIPVRVLGCGVVTVRDLVRKRRAELLFMPLMGPKLVDVVEAHLAAHGLRLARPQNSQ